MAVVNIPAPGSKVLQTWLKGPRDKKLVYSVTQKKWVIVDSTKVIKEDVVYEDYQKGEKTYGSPSANPPVLGADGKPVTAGVSRYQATINPLQPFIDKYGLSVKTDANGETYLADKQNIPYYLYLTSDGSLKLDKDYDKVKAAALADFKKSGKLNSLFEELYAKKVISQQTYLTKSTTANDFNSGLIFLINEYSKSVIANNAPNKDPQDFFSFIKGVIGTGGGDENLPRRDINLYDRNVVEAIVRDAFAGSTDMSPDEYNDFIQQKTDMYMDQIKKGTLTTTKKVGGEMVSTTTKPFSESQVRAELPGMIKKELPGALVPKNSFDFLAFLDGMGAQVV